MNRTEHMRDMQMYLPLFLVLTLAATLNAFQIYAPLDHEAVQTRPEFFPLLLSRLAYAWYFLLLAVFVQKMSRIVALTQETALRWSLVHGASLAGSFFIHETVTFALDRLLLGRLMRTDILSMLFQDPAVWIEAFMYVMLLLFFSLGEYRRRSRENEEACAELEEQLARTRLRELRSRIQPAFLFRTLETIGDLVGRKRNEDANRILAALGDFLRATVYDTSGADEAVRTRRLEDVSREIERIVHEDQDTHHR